MPLFIKDDTTAELVTTLAKRRRLTKQDAVKLAVEAELARDAINTPLLERLEKLWHDNPMPPRTGLAADKAFFDELSGEA